jgi:hypothetical protein
VKFFKTAVTFFIFKNKILYIKIFNCFWKLVNYFSGIYLNSYFNKLNFYSNSGFFFLDHFFFKLKFGYLKFNLCNNMYNNKALSILSD